MTRTGVIFGLLLAVVSIVGGIQGYVNAASTASLVAGLVAGGVLVPLCLLALRGHGWAQVGMMVVALGLLGRFLPAYFRDPVPWPGLVVILLSAFTLGFSLLGLVLDRYRPGPDKS